MLLRISRTVLLLFVASMPAWPQVEFEVASIRPSPPGMTARDARRSLHDTHFEAKAMTVGDLLDGLNGFQLLRVVGGPDWMRTDRYDIEAKAGQPMNMESVQQAVKALLAERFHLESHRERREVPGIVLRASRTPAGLKQASSEDRYSIGNDRGDVVFKAVSMPGVTNYLSQMWQAPLCGRNGIEGNLRLHSSDIAG